MTQRIIKFRAYVTNGPAVRVYENVGLLNGRVLDSKGEVINKAVLMQFTGLLDKNGKEIYEGDVIAEIVTQFSTGKRLELNKQVVKIAPFYFSDYEDSCSGSGFMVESCSLEDIAENWEVIGNIYEHPTLISHPLT